MSADIILRAALAADAAFVHECLKSLRGRAEYEIQDVVQYLERLRLSENSASAILVALHEGTAVGLLTVIRFAMPRYLGYGIELEEVVVHQEFRRMGYGGAMIAALMRSVEGDRDLRTVRVRTDDHSGSGRLYASLFTATESRMYAKSVNPL